MKNVNVKNSQQFLFKKRKENVLGVKAFKKGANPTKLYCNSDICWNNMEMNLTTQYHSMINVDSAKYHIM